MKFCIPVYKSAIHLHLRCQARRVQSPDRERTSSALASRAPTSCRSSGWQLLCFSAIAAYHLLIMTRTQAADPLHSHQRRYRGRGQARQALLQYNNGLSTERCILRLFAIRDCARRTRPQASNSKIVIIFRPEVGGRNQPSATKRRARRTRAPAGLRSLTGRIRPRAQGPGRHCLSGLWRRPAPVATLVTASVATSLSASFKGKI